jgi:hypothetical protein
METGRWSLLGGVRSICHWREGRACAFEDALSHASAGVKRVLVGDAPSRPWSLSKRSRRFETPTKALFTPADASGSVGRLGFVLFIEARS